MSNERFVFDSLKSAAGRCTLNRSALLACRFSALAVFVLALSALLYRFLGRAPQIWVLGIPPLLITMKLLAEALFRPISPRAAASFLDANIPTEDALKTLCALADSRFPHAGDQQFRELVAERAEQRLREFPVSSVIPLQTPKSLYLFAAGWLILALVVLFPKKAGADEYQKELEKRMQAIRERLADQSHEPTDEDVKEAMDNAITGEGVNNIGDLTTQGIRDLLNRIKDIREKHEHEFKALADAMKSAGADKLSAALASKDPKQMAVAVAEWIDKLKEDPKKLEAFLNTLRQDPDLKDLTKPAETAAQDWKGLEDYVLRELAKHRDNAEIQALEIQLRVLERIKKELSGASGAEDGKAATKQEPKKPEKIKPFDWSSKTPDALEKESIKALEQRDLSPREQDIVKKYFER